MIYCSLNQNTYYESSANTLDYKIVDGDGNVIYFGHSIKNPRTGINKINITEIIRDYLSNNLEDSWPELSTGTTYVYKQGNAFGVFSLINEQITMETYKVLYDYVDLFAGTKKILTEPINGKLDARMKFFWTAFNTETTQYYIPPGLVLSGVTNYDYKEQEGYIWVLECSDWEGVSVVSNNDWITAVKTETGVTLYLEANRTDGDRSGSILFYHHSTLIRKFNLLQGISDYYGMYLTTRAVSNGDIILFAMDMGDLGTNAIDVAYRKNGGQWITANTISEISVSVSSGDTVQWKSETEGVNVSGNTFENSTAYFKAEGNVMSLAFSDNFDNYTSLSGTSYDGDNITFRYLFNGCSALTNAEFLMLPATTLSEGCYKEMFGGCTSLTKAPLLPAITLAKDCYELMFGRCMSLTKAPDLLAPNLAGGCYKGMFNICSSLSYIKCLAQTFANASTYAWVWGVNTTGTFVKKAGVNWQLNYPDGIPTGWTVKTDD